MSDQILKVIQALIAQTNVTLGEMNASLREQNASLREMNARVDSTSIPSKSLSPIALLDIR